MGSKIKQLVGMIVEFNQEILIIQRAFSLNYLPGQWTFVAGHVDKNESFENAVSRELYEETGLKGVIGSNFGVKSWEWIEKEIIHNQFLFNITANSKDVVMGDEIVDYKWVDIEDSVQFNCLDEFNLDILYKYKEALNII